MTVASVSNSRMEMSEHASLHFDAWLLLSALGLMVVGLIMIGSASMDIADLKMGQPFYYVIRHGSFLILALVSGLVAYGLPIEWWHKRGWLLLSLALVGLVVVLLPGIGKTVNGSTRWIGFGSLNLQVSEFAKLFLVAYVAGYLARRQGEIADTWWGFAKPLLVIGIAAGLLMKEPDFGATVVIMTAVLGMLFLAGVSLVRFCAVIGVTGALGVLAVLSSDYRYERLTGYIDPWADQFGSGYQLTQALIAFGRGEWFGVGLGNSVQKLFYLPEAHTDFVFAIFAEEFGLLGSLVVISLFVIIVWRALWLGYRASIQGLNYSAYFAYGIGLLLAAQSLINLGVSCGLLPTKGLTLPLVSYGGSSLIVSCIAIGILTRLNAEVAMVEDGGQQDISA